MRVSTKTVAIAYPDKFLSPDEVAIIAAKTIAESLSKDSETYLTSYGAYVSGTSGGAGEDR